MERAQFKANLPQPMYDNMKKAAETDGMTMNAFMVRAMTLYMKLWEMGRNDNHIYLQDEDGRFVRVMLL
jgi:hypothetical protein